MRFHCELSIYLCNEMFWQTSHTHTYQCDASFMFAEVMEIVARVSLKPSNVGPNKWSCMLGDQQPLHFHLHYFRRTIFARVGIFSLHSYLKAFEWIQRFIASSQMCIPVVWCVFVATTHTTQTHTHTLSTRASLFPWHLLNTLEYVTGCVLVFSPFIKMEIYLNNFADNFVWALQTGKSASFYMCSNASMLECKMLSMTTITFTHRERSFANCKRKYLEILHKHFTMR